MPKDLIPRVKSYTISLLNTYYIFIAILMLFEVIFEDDKSDNFLRD